MLLTSRTDPRILRTRHAIMNAFQELLSQRGLMPLTVGDISTHAGINRATFYAHYQDKYDLFSQLIRDHLNTMLEQQSPPFQFHNQALESLLQTLCNFQTQVYDRCHVHDQEMAVQIELQVRQQLQDRLLEGLNQCFQTPNAQRISRETTAMLVGSILFAAAMKWGQGEVKEILEQYIAEVMVFLNAVVVATGFKPRKGTH